MITDDGERWSAVASLWFFCKEHPFQTLRDQTITLYPSINILNPGIKYPHDFDLDKLPSAKGDCAEKLKIVKQTEKFRASRSSWYFRIDSSRENYSKCYYGTGAGIGNGIIKLEISPKYRRCGYGTLLMMLCLQDRTANLFNGNSKDVKVKSFPEATGNDHGSETDDQYFNKQTTWLKKNCENVWFVPLKHDKDNGFVYLNAAVNSHYSKMIIIDRIGNVPLPLPITIPIPLPIPLPIPIPPHPTDGAEDTEYYRAKFDQETWFITLFSEIYGQTYKTYKKSAWTNYARNIVWIFCKPKPSLNIDFNK